MIAAPLEANTELCLLNTKIVALEMELAALRERRNYIISPLHRIPLELLCKILFIAQQTPRRTWNLQRTWERQWLKGAAACRRSWAVALSSPELWSTIPLRNPPTLRGTYPWIDMCLIRVGTVPLDVDVCLAWAEIQVPRLLEIAGQTGHLSLDIPAPTICNMDHAGLLRSLLDHAWETLRTLRIGLSTLQWDISSETLGGFAEKLSSLELAGEGRWRIGGMPHLPRLETLKVSNLELSTSMRVLLTQTPRLTWLQINFHSWRGQELRPSEGNTPEIVASGLLVPGLRVLRLSGHMTVLHEALSVLPDPHEELSIFVHPNDMDKGLWPQEDPITAFVIARAFKYARRDNATHIQTHYALIMGRLPGRGFFRGVYENSSADVICIRPAVQQDAASYSRRGTGQATQHRISELHVACASGQSPAILVHALALSEISISFANELGSTSRHVDVLHDQLFIPFHKLGFTRLDQTWSPSTFNMFKMYLKSYFRGIYLTQGNFRGLIMPEYAPSPRDFPEWLQELENFMSPVKWNSGT